MRMLLLVFMSNLLALEMADLLSGLFALIVFPDLASLSNNEVLEAVLVSLSKFYFFSPFLANTLPFDLVLFIDWLSSSLNL